MKILLTGGTGYIGSHTAVELILQGFDVLIVDDLSNSSVEVLDRIDKITGVKPEFIQLDLRDYSAVSKVFDTHHLDGVIHFAAKKAVGESVKKPVLYYDVNVNSLLNLTKLMQKHGELPLVFSSSCTVYGQPDKLPVTEQTPFQPAESPYGNSKQICEEILRDTCYSDPSVKAISLRYFNPVGAHDSALIGELPLGIPANLIPYITQTAIGMRDELKVYGHDYPTPDGTAIRDYIHVVDLAKAHAKAVSRLVDQKQKNNYEYFNLGTGKGSSVLQVIQTFEQVNELKLNYQIVERREGDVIQIYADTTFANEELGWKTELGLEEMMSSAWKWQKFIGA